MPGPSDIAALFQEVHAHPDDDTVRSVLADALLAIGDPRGELIALQLASEPTTQQLDRCDALIGEHGKAWLGELALLGGARFQRGFVSELALWNRGPIPADDPRLTISALATIERLSGAAADAVTYARFVCAPALVALREIEVWDRITVEALEHTAAPLRRVACVLDDNLHELSHRIVAACHRKPSIVSLGISLAMWDTVENSGLFEQLTELHVSGDLREILARRDQLPDGVTLVAPLSPWLSNRVALRLAPTAGGLEAMLSYHRTHDSEAFVSTVVDAFAHLPPLQRLIVYGPTPRDDDFVALGRKRRLTVDLANTLRDRGMFPDEQR